MIERQRVDQRPEIEPLGALRDGGEKHARGGRHAERRRMMLGDLIAIEAEPVVKLDQLQPVLVEIAQRRAGGIQVVEYAERQCHCVIPPAFRA